MTDTLVDVEYAGSKAEKMTNQENKTKARRYEGGVNVGKMLLTSLLMLGPIMFGITINNIGNAKYIKIHFAKQDGYVTETVTEKDYPAALWSLGCLFPLGGLVGSLVGALTVDRFGRKAPSIVFCICLIIGVVLKVVSVYLHSSILFLGRFFDGIGSSGVMVSLLLLVFETIPRRTENAFKPLVQIFVNLGIVLIGALTLYHVAGINWNHYMLFTILIPIILLLVILVYPESPKYTYLSTRDWNKTRNVFLKLRGKYFDESELIDLQNSTAAQENVRRMTIMEFITNKNYRLAIISLVFLHIGQQLSGINAIIAFSPTLLASAGIDSPDIGGLMIASVGLLGSSCFAPIVGNKKRKLLWIIGFVFMVFSFIGYIVTSAFEFGDKLKIFFLCLFVFMFQLGPGPVVWFISVEMFPPVAVGAAQGVASFFNWLANSIIFLVVPILTANIGEKTLIIFLVIQILILIYSIFILEETLDRTPEQVIAAYNRTMQRFCGRKYEQKS